MIILCFLYIFMACACDNGQSPDPSGTTDASQSAGTTATSGQEDSYKNITCAKITAFREVWFCETNSRTQIRISFPKQWTLEESDNGYQILQASKVIGGVTLSAAGAETGENVHSEDTRLPGINITNRIDRVTSEGKTGYIRTLSYRYTEAEGDSRTVTITMPYELIDDDGVRTMINKAERQIATDPQMGVLPLTNGRKTVLILGNSFVASSKVGSILQTMCGSKLSVEAQSRAYARVTTYVQDTSVMNSIRSGDYAAVILCGLYDSASLVNLEQMVNACAASNTKLAIFPAHNEDASMIKPAGTMYPTAVMLNWKSEIDSLIAGGIDQSHFCVADSHKHSTPLAGYVGAHMIYRAIFDKIPEEKSYSDVAQQAIALLGEYASTGSVSFSKPDATYPMKAD